ncbi:MAG: (2Fe-2S) ferredoxin domain-containing protein [Christensenellales bacterium]
MKITICIGSSCHLKGSRQIVESLQELVEQNGLNDRIQLSGTFCMGRCMEGVCVQLDEEFFSLKPEETQSFFTKDVLPRLRF